MYILHRRNADANLVEINESTSELLDNQVQIGPKGCSLCIVAQRAP